jgi:hypothetical protein
MDGHCSHQNRIDSDCGILDNPEILRFNQKSSRQLATNLFSRHADRFNFGKGRLYEGLGSSRNSGCSTRAPNLPTKSPMYSCGQRQADQISVATAEPTLDNPSFRCRLAATMRAFAHQLIWF